MPKGTIYGLYLDGNLVVKGCNKDVLHFFGINYKTSIRKMCLKSGKFMGKYDVQIEEEINDDKPVVKPYRYQYVLDNIRLHGNSIVTHKSDLDEVLGFLGSNGYKVKVRTVPKRGHESAYWVLER